MKIFQILIIDDHSPDVFWLDLQSAINRKVRNEFFFKTNILDACTELKKNSAINLILSKEKINNEVVLDLMVEFLTKENLNIPILLRQSPENKDNKKMLNEIYYDRSLDLLKNTIDECIDYDDEQKSEYVAILAEKFLNIDQFQLNCDVYIKIRRTGKTDQFIKRLHANDKFTKEEVQKYIDSGLKEFYIPYEKYSDFINLVSIELIKSLKERMGGDGDSYSINSFGYETAIERLKIFMSVDTLTVRLVDESIKSMVKSVEKNEALLNFVANIKGKNVSFAFAHCYLIAILSEKISKHFEWNSQQARLKLFYLAFYHDISLKNLSWTEINSKDELEDASLKEIDKMAINNHAAISAELLERFKEIPFGLSQLVKEHHGSKSGIGFTDSLSINISPMAMAFIVLEDFTSLFLKNKVESLSEIEKLISILELKYTKLTYLQTISALRSILVRPERKKPN